MSLLANPLRASADVSRLPAASSIDAAPPQTPEAQPAAQPAAHYLGHRAEVRALTTDDLLTLAPQPAVAQAMAAYRPWLPVDQVPVSLLARRLAWLERLDPPPEREALVLHRATRTPLGLICLAAIDPENRKAELAVAFFRGQGSRTALEALHWSLETAFQAFGLVKLVFYVQPENRAALAVLQSLQVAQEARLQREIVLADGSRGDLLRFALFAEDWFAGPGRRRLQRLAPLLTAEPAPSPEAPY